MPSRTLAAAVGASTFLAVLCHPIAHARGDDPQPPVAGATPPVLPKEPWRPVLTFGGRLGEKRHIGTTDVMLPVLQDDRAMLYADLRGMIDSNGASEGNFGLGYREILDGRWIVGGYGFFDRRRSERDNFFNQLTLGAEALSETWDARVNAYFPLSDPAGGGNGPAGGGYLSGHSVFLTGIGEVPMGGFDVEVGRAVPGVPGLRLYAAGYRFDAHDVEAVTGWRLRGDYRIDRPFGTKELPDHWISLGAEVQSDRRGTDAAVTLSVSFQIGEPGRSAAYRRPTALERRMTERPVRDVDIVTAQGGGEERVDMVVYYVDNRAAPGGDGSYERPFRTLQEAEDQVPPGAVIFVYAGDGTTAGLVLDATNGLDHEFGLTLKPGQSLLGEGAGLVVRGVPLIAPGSYPKLAAVRVDPLGQEDPGDPNPDANDGESVAVVTMADGTSVRGVEIANSGTAIRASGARDVLVAGNHLHGNDTGVELQALDGQTVTALVQGNRITGNGFGIDVQRAGGGVSSVALVENTVSGNSIANLNAVGTTPLVVGSIADEGLMAGFGRGINGSAIQFERAGGGVEWVQIEDLILGQNLVQYCTSITGVVCDANSTLTQQFQAIHQKLRNVEHLTYWMVEDYNPATHPADFAAMLPRVQRMIDAGVTPVFAFWYFGDNLGLQANPQAWVAGKMAAFQAATDALGQFLGNLNGDVMVVIEPEFNKENVRTLYPQFADVLVEGIGRIRQNATAANGGNGKDTGLLFGTAIMDLGAKDVNQADPVYGHKGLGDWAVWDQTHSFMDTLAPHLDFVGSMYLFTQFRHHGTLGKKLDGTTPDPNDGWFPGEITDKNVEGFDYFGRRVTNFAAFLKQEYGLRYYLPYMTIATGTWTDDDAPGHDLHGYVELNEVDPDGWNDEAAHLLEQLNAEVQNLRDLGAFGMSHMFLFDEHGRNPDPLYYAFLVYNEMYAGLIETGGANVAGAPVTPPLTFKTDSGGRVLMDLMFPGP